MSDKIDTLEELNNKMYELINQYTDKLSPLEMVGSMQVLIYDILKTAEEEKPKLDNISLN